MAVGGTINGAYVGNGGILYLSGWAGAIQVSTDSGNTIAGAQYLDEGVLNAVRLDSGGQLGAIYETQFGGKAPSVIANAGGGILNGVTANGVAYVSGLDYAGNITLTNGQQGIDLTVRGFKTITSRDAEGNPTAYTTTIASLNVSSGGIVKNATVGEEGAIYVSEGANVSGLTASGGRIIFENAGSGWGNYLPASAAVAGITVKDGGILQVNSKFSLTATNLQIGESAGLDVYIAKEASDDFGKTELNGSWATTWGSGTFQTNDGVLTGFGGQFGYEYRDLFYSSAYTSARLGMIFLNGGVLSGGDLRGYGYVTARNGGKLINTHLQGITANIGASGYASGLTATTESTGSAYDTNIYVYGSGALAEQTLLSGGFLAVETGATADGVIMLAPEGYEGPAGDNKTVGPAEMEITGGLAKNVVASAGLITLYEGSSKEPGTAPATLSNADVHSAATLLINADGVVLDGTLNLGGLVVTTATRYEYVEVEVTNPDTGDVYTDWQRIEKNNAVANATTLTVNFDLTERNGAEEGVMIDNLANLDGVTLSTVKVSDTQDTGAYILAGGSDAFNGTLSVVRGSENVGTISVGGFLQVEEELVYKLSNSTDDGLVFSVLSTAAAVTDIIATVGGNPLQKGTWTNKTVNIKTEVNEYSKSIWYRIRRALATRGEDEDEGWVELDNENGVDIAEYCTVDFKAKNESGKDSRIVSYTVNYDGVAPVISDLRADSGEAVLPVGSEELVSVLVNDDLDEMPTLQFSRGDGVWTDLERGADGRFAFTVTGGSEFLLRTTDHADNVATLAVAIPDEPTVSADIVTVTNQDVTVTAAFGTDSTLRQYSVDGENWEAYNEAIVLSENGTLHFRAGNILGYSEISSITVDYIDKVAPVITLAGDTTTPLYVTTLTATTEEGIDILYSMDNENWLACNGPIEVTANGAYLFQATDAAGNLGTATITFENILPAVAENLVATPDKTSWEAVGADACVVEYSTDNFEHVIQVVTTGTATDLLDLPAGTYQWRVKGDVDGEWTVGEQFVAEGDESDAPRVVESNEDGNDDIFFATPTGTWGKNYVARHNGSINGWSGTRELVSANGKGRIQNLFFGSADPNVLLLTDNDNGDALFVDDVYTGLPESIEENQARLFKIAEIRAGAGDDIIDLTSQRFEYVGDGMTVRGGLGNDVIWANKGDNLLFGDEGNDRIVGCSGDDLLVGGAGNDRLHGGGGNDIFAFGGNWGNDNVAQLEDGQVTLWFAEGNEANWDAEALTYTDGENSVKVTGVSAAAVSLKFGDDGSKQFTALQQSGAFEEFSSQKIFEQEKGMLA